MKMNSSPVLNSELICARPNNAAEIYNLSQYTLQRNRQHKLL